MAKSMIYTVNNAGTTIAAGGIIPLGTTVRRYGSGVHLSGDAIELSGAGYYKVTVTATLVPTTASTVGVRILNNGVAVQGGVAVAETTAALQDVTLPAEAVVRVVCGCIGGSITVELTGAESAVSNLAVIVEKM